MTEPDPRPSDRHAAVEALLALALDDAPAPRGRPSAAELAAWHEGRLSGARAEAVRAWVARTAEGYALWSALPPPAVAMAPTVTAAAAGGPRHPGPWARIRHWFVRHPWQGAGLGLVPAALAALLLLTITLPGPRVSGPDAELDALAAALAAQPLPPVPAATAGFAPRHFRPLPVADPERAAFAAGVHAALPAGRLPPDWSAWLSRLPPEAAAACTAAAGARCPQQRAALRTAGRWSALAYRQCAPAPQRPDAAASAPALARTADVLAPRLATLAPYGAFGSRVVALLGERSAPPGQVCEHIRALLIDLPAP